MWEIETRFWNVWSKYDGEVPQNERGARETYQHLYSLLKESEGIRLLHNGEQVDAVIIDPSTFSKVHGG